MTQEQEPKIEDLAIESGTTERGVKWAIAPVSTPDDGKTVGAVFVPEGHPWREVTPNGRDVANELGADVGTLGEPNEGWFAVVTFGGANVWGDEEPDVFAQLMGSDEIHWTTELVREKTLKLADMVADASVPA